MTELVRLGDFAKKIGSGQTPQGGSSSYSEEGTPLIRSQNVLQGSFSRNGLVYISDKIDRLMSNSRVLPNDVLLNITGASIGRVCVVPEEVCPANINQHVCIIRCDDRLSPGYLAAFLRSPKVQSFIWESQSGATRQALTKQMIEEFKIPLPPLTEQKVIAGVLDKKLSLIQIATDALASQRTAISALLAATFREIFHDVVPITLPDGVGVPPEKWNWRKLIDVAKLESGHTPSRYRPDWWGGNISWVSLTEIRALDGKWVEETQIKTNPLGIANSSARVLPRGTVCFSRTASVGFVTILSRPMATSQDFANWICGDQIDSEFLMLSLIASRSELRAIASGATHKTIYMPELKSFYVCMPSYSEQRRVVSLLQAKLADIETLRCAIEQQARDLTHLPGRVLNQVFEGK